MPASPSFFRSPYVTASQWESSLRANHILLASRQWGCSQAVIRAVGPATDPGARGHLCVRVYECAGVRKQRAEKEQPLLSLQRGVTWCIFYGLILAFTRSDSTAVFCNVCDKEYERDGVRESKSRRPVPPYSSLQWNVSAYLKRSFYNTLLYARHSPIYRLPSLRPSPPRAPVAMWTGAEFEIGSFTQEHLRRDPTRSYKYWY